MPMKIILSHAYFLCEDAIEQKLMMPYPPIGLLCVSSYLEQHGVEHKVFDTTFLKRTEFVEQLFQEKPDVLAFYVNLMTRAAIVEIISVIRKHPDFYKTRIILGGPEVRTYASEWLSKGANLLVIGEGERTFYELMLAIEKEADLKDIKGIAFNDSSGKTAFTEEREPLSPDEIPVPARHRIEMQKYLQAWKIHHGYSAMNINSMRGCPYSCKWCSKAVFGNSVRRRSPASVVNEMQQLLNEYHFDRLWFTDDVFTLQTAWLTAFEKELKQKNLNIPYEIITRADCLDDESISILKRTGCIKVWVGGESGSDKMLLAMGRRVSVAQVQQAIHLLQQAGIKAGTFIMLGYPGEQLKDIRASIQHLKMCQPLQYTLGLTYPIKGTELWNEVEVITPYGKSWEHCSDRDLDFKRNFSRRFYNYAIRWVYNEVEYHRASKRKRLHLKTWVFKAKAIAARIAMMIYR